MNVVRRGIIGTILSVLILGVSSADAEPIHPILPIPNSEFKEVLPTSTNEIIIETRNVHVRTTSPKPKVRLPDNPARSVSRETKPAAPNLTGNFTYGTASYYCLRGKSRCTVGHPGGQYAAIRKDLLFLKGKTVSVCKGKHCIPVTIIDCNCGKNANLIDLYSDAFKKLAPISDGIIKGIKVSW